MFSILKNILRGRSAVATPAGTQLTLEDQARLLQEQLQDSIRRAQTPPFPIPADEQQSRQQSRARTPERSVASDSTSGSSGRAKKPRRKAVVSSISKPKKNKAPTTKPNKNKTTTATPLRRSTRNRKSPELYGDFELTPVVVSKRKTPKDVTFKLKPEDVPTPEPSPHLPKPPKKLAKDDPNAKFTPDPDEEDDGASVPTSKKPAKKKNADSTYKDEGATTPPASPAAKAKAEAKAKRRKKKPAARKKAPVQKAARGDVAKTKAKGKERMVRFEVVIDSKRSQPSDKGKLFGIF